MVGMESLNPILTRMAILLRTTTVLTPTNLRIMVPITIVLPLKTTTITMVLKATSNTLLMLKRTNPVEECWTKRFFFRSSWFQTIEALT